jgi:hypothetical protein
MNLKEWEPVQLTQDGVANLVPYRHPDGRQVIFASDMRESNIFVAGWCFARANAQRTTPCLLAVANWPGAQNLH